MTVILILWCILALLLYRIWQIKSEKKDFFIVEYRQLYREGADIFDIWKDEYGLMQDKLSRHGLSGNIIDDSMSTSIMRGDVIIGGSTLFVWQTYEIAESHFAFLSNTQSYPAYEAVTAFLWAVRANGEKQARSKFREGFPHLVKASTPRRTEWG